MHKTSALMAAALATLSHAALADPARSIIVMDGSGSMWGQIDGRAKLEIARDTLGEVLATLPESQELGLLAYGHRRRGDCSDIELLVAPAPGQAGAIRDAANAMRFQGKTPLTEAVRQAALDLRSTEEPATVVLITDGLETCDGDPCALARELEASGVDFTAHVVGFGLSEAEGANLACLATETGGRYLGAKDADALREALSTTIAAAPEPEPAPAPAPLPTATLTAPQSAPRASKITVAWTGPAREGDYIDIAPFDGDGTHSITSGPVEAAEGQIELQVPAELGEYVIRYVSTLTPEEMAAEGAALAGRSFATQTLTVTDVEKYLRVPQTIEQGAMVPADWAGPEGEDDWLAIFRADYVSSDAFISTAALSDGSPARLRAPIDLGDYVAAYVVEGSDGAKMLLEAPFTLVPSTAQIIAPERVPPGADFPVRFIGQSHGKNYVDLVAEGEERLHGYDGLETLGYFYLADQDGPIDATLTAPTTPGTYDLRYVVTAQGARLGNDILLLSRRSVIVDPNMEDVPVLPQSTAPAQPAPSPGTTDTAPFHDSEEDVGHVCLEASDCAIVDDEAAIAFTLPAGWMTNAPYRPALEAPLQIAFFGVENYEHRVTLNMPTALAAGPSCLPTDLGTLCHADDPASQAAFGTLLRSLKEKD